MGGGDEAMNFKLNVVSLFSFFRRNDPPLCVITQDSMTVDEVGESLIHCFLWGWGICLVIVGGAFSLCVCVCVCVCVHSCMCVCVFICHLLVGFFVFIEKHLTDGT